MTLRSVLLPEKPANRITFLEDGTACLLVLPFARECTDDEQRTFETAPRARIFLYACGDAPVPEGVSRPSSIYDLPRTTLSWAVRKATFIAPGIVPENSENTEADLADVLLQILEQTPEGTDHRFHVTLIVDDPAELGQYLSRTRPNPPNRGIAVARSFKRGRKR
ncbi:hypothetical protein [Bradyrhizobium iriomotense]|uniref:Uncharacterized protein n=1 Tax=Bradyrhizobium iriomotense TaxID=441950 RepID=A0ABQ6BBZ8_9BRAD|nr:hypothetical protein [Bradyrhizobium iriomotense]GLR91308.1 hypothetical protein GCM10007857_80250 [Bradyrhizobium iriomotense]